MALNIATINGRPNPAYVEPERHDVNRNEPAAHGWVPIGDKVWQFGGIGQIILTRSSTLNCYWQLSYFGDVQPFRLGVYVDWITAYVKAELAEMEAALEAECISF